RGHLFEKLVNAIAKRVLEIAHPAEERIGIADFLEIPSRVQNELPPHVVKDESPAGAGDFAAFHRVAALDVVASRESADGAVFEFHAEMRRRPDLPARRFSRKALHSLDVAAEIAHDIDRVRMQRLDLIVRRAL